MPNGDGTAFALSSFRLTTADGATDRGSLLFLHDFKATHPPQLPQIDLDWAGPVVSADGSATYADGSVLRGSFGLGPQ